MSGSFCIPQIAMEFLDNSFAGGSTAGQNLAPYSNEYDRRADWGPSGNDIENRLPWFCPRPMLSVSKAS